MDGRGVAIRHMRFLRGPNIHAYMPVLKVELEIGEYDEKPSDDFPGFVDRLTSWLPGLAKHECSVGRPGGFVERLRRGTYLPHIVEHVTLELQSQMGFDVTFGRARGTGRRGVYDVLVAYREEEPARRAFEKALELTLAAMHDQPFDVAEEVEQLRDLADRYRLGPSTGAIVRAARRRGIPIMRLTPTGSLVQLGYGVYQKRILASETSNTSQIAVELCQEKPLTNQMLRAVGVPVPDGRPVRSADEAWEVAQDVGLPVVVKPEGGNQGKGVSVNLRSEADIRSAYEVAADYRGGVLVERYIEGDDYRLLVVNGKMIAASRRDPPVVVGDGTRTVRQLVAEVNRDPRRRAGHSSALTRIRLDAAAELVLRQQGLTPDGVPAPGQQVRLRQNANLSTGGTATDVTDEVHPSNVRLVELAAQILDLDVAGIDVICHDITRPLGEQGGAIVEVNAAPGLRMHLDPTSGQPRDVASPIVEMLYPQNAPSRIPIIAVTGTNGKTTVTRLIGHMHETARKVVGLTCTDGTYIGGERIIRGDCSGPKSGRAVLLHPRVEVAVLETARGGILREGLAFDWCQVGVVTNISPDHLGIGGIETVDDLARVKQVVVENIHRTGAAVLNAEDPRVAEMAAATEARVIYFAHSREHPVMAAHLASGGWGVYVHDGHVVVHNGVPVELVGLDRVPFTGGGRIRFQVENALAATAAAWAVGLNPALIARALSTFRTDSTSVPGRFNLVELGGVEVVVDYAHNPAALAALGQGIQALGDRRTVLLIGLPGDRRDEDIRASVQATRSYVHEYVFYDPPDRRGRRLGEIPELMQAALGGAAPATSAVDQAEGVLLAWRRVRPGDRLLLIVDDVDGALEQSRSLAASLTEDAACTAPMGTGAAAF